MKLTVHVHLVIHTVIYCVVISTTNPLPIRFHPINPDLSFRLWSPVSNGLVHTDGSKVTFKGSFNDGSNSVVKAKHVLWNDFHLVFNGDGPSASYQYITSHGQGKQVTVASSPTSQSVFVPDYYWGKTVFRSKPHSNLYLGSDSNNKATLVPIQDLNYPNPQALMVVHKI